MLPHRNVQMLVLKNKIANLWNLKFDRWNDVCDEQIVATVCAKHESEDSAARLSNFTRVLLQFWLQLFQKWLKFRFHWNQRHTHTHTPVMWSRYAMAIKSIILPHIFWRQHLPVNQISLSQKKKLHAKMLFHGPWLMLLQPPEDLTCTRGRHTCTAFSMFMFLPTECSMDRTNLSLDVILINRWIISNGQVQTKWY